MLLTYDVSNDCQPAPMHFLPKCITATSVIAEAPNDDGDRR